MLVKTPPHMILASDIAGLGKVATTAALPLLATCQVEVAVLPTVLLSSHTGGFPSVYVESHTQGMESFLQQWKKLPLSFEALMTGYLKEKKQVDVLLDYAKQAHLPLIVDPIMGDKGELYQGFDKEFVSSMRHLASKADLLIPNLTEACLLLERPYPNEELTQLDYQNLCQELHQMGAKTVVLTGLPLSEERLGLALYEGEKGNFHLYSSTELPYHFFGTGDIVAAMLAGAWVQKLALRDVIPAILDFMDQALQATICSQPDLRVGVFYQPFLGQWAQQFQTFLEEQNQ